MARIYSIMFEGDDMTLVDHFFEDNREYVNELKEMAARLYAMGHFTGCRVQFFKEDEGAPGDGVVALRYRQMKALAAYINRAIIHLIRCLT